MENKIKLNITPILPNYWWENKEKKELTLIPETVHWDLGNIHVVKEKGTRWWKEEREVSWPWWVMDYGGEKIHLYISFPTKILAYETSQEDNVLELLLDLFLPKVSIEFNISIDSKTWDVKKISDDFLCNTNQRRMAPNISLVDRYIGSGVTNGFVYSKGEEWGIFGSKQGTYEATYIPSGEKVLFDIKLDPTTYTFRINIGVEEKSKISNAQDIRRKLSFIEALTLPAKQQWIELINLLSKKQ